MSTRLVPPITVAGAFLACNALTGAGDLETGDLDAAAPGPPTSADGSTSGAAGTSGAASSTSGTGGTSSGVDASSSSSSSGEPDSGSASSSSSSSGGPAPVALLDEPFDVDHCKDWSTVNAFVQWQSSFGHGKPGMCVVCSGQISAYSMTKTVTAPRAGKVVAQMYAGRVPGFSEPPSVQVVISVDGVDTTASADIGNDFTLVKNGGTSVANGASITIKLGRPSASAGECFDVDDVTATLD